MHSTVLVKVKSICTPFYSCCYISCNLFLFHAVLGPSEVNTKGCFPWWFHGLFVPGQGNCNCPLMYLKKNRPIALGHTEVVFLLLARLCQTHISLVICDNGRGPSYYWIADWIFIGTFFDRYRTYLYTWSHTILLFLTWYSIIFFYFTHLFLKYI